MKTLKHKFILAIFLTAILFSACKTTEAAGPAKEKSNEKTEPQMLENSNLPKATQTGNTEFEMETLATARSTLVDYGEKKLIEYYSTTTGKNRKAYVILPAGYEEGRKSGKKYPVMYLLHGIGGTENEWFYGKPQEIIGNLIAKNEVVPFITVVPNIRAREEDYKTDDIFSESNINAFNNFINDLKNDLMPYVSKNFSISQERKDTAICGLSMGGMESLNIGFRMLDTFGYIGAFSPAPTLDTSVLTLKNSSFTPYLVLVCNGSTDSVVHDTPKTYHNVLNGNKVEHLWYEYLGGDHNFVVWNHGLYNFTKRIFKE